MNSDTPQPALATDVASPAYQAPPPELLGKAYDLLQELLRQEEGEVSSTHLRKTLISRLAIAKDMAAECSWELRHLDPEKARLIGRPDGKTYHKNRSFFSKEKYGEAVANTEREAVQSEQEAEETPPAEEEEKEQQQNRQEEARLGVYVKDTLQNLYDSDYAPEDTPLVFDVHRDRPGGGFENVDIIAVHWRSINTVDLVSVEVKLDFSPKAVHQACSYTRFSHRVWVACVVNNEAQDAAMELRTTQPGLFDYAVNRGIGILGCRRTQGRAYQVFPIHWPTWQNPEPIEKEHFVERYHDQFVEAGVIEERRRTARF